MGKKYNLEFAQELARSKGGECLSDRYINCVTKMRWRCERGHEWETKLAKINNEGSWCPRCKFDAKKLSIDTARRLARERGGECLSEKYINIKSKLRWRCNRGHEWESALDNIKSKNAWCRECYDISQRCTLEEAQKIAEERKGKCLSEEYINTRVKMKWECDKGHRWETKFDTIRQGKWCPVCVRANRTTGGKILTIDTAKKIAEERGGKCLSEKYTNGRSKLKWRCKHGHKWDATLESVRLSKSWCDKCAIISISNSIEDAKELARSRGGKCISDSYANVESRLEWECEQGHRWITSYKNAQRGKWCKQCYLDRVTNTIEDAQRLADERGGECLSDTYVNGETKLMWKCGKKQHIWEATYSSVRQGSWCPYCKFRSENACREIFENLWESPFPKVRPEFLRQTSKSCLELDGYNEQLKIAFEYQGKQHYVYCPHFHRTETALQEIQERDRIKYELCKDQGIELFLVPYHFTYQDPGEMETYIIDQFITRGLWVDFKSR